MLRAEYPNPLIIRGSHSTPGRDGTTLSFEVFVERSGLGEVSATLAVGTYASDAKVPRDARVYAVADDERSALTRLASYLRRCAEAIDAGIDTVKLPAPREPREVPDVS